MQIRKFHVMYGTNKRIFRKLCIICIIAVQNLLDKSRLEIRIQLGNFLYLITEILFLFIIRTGICLCIRLFFIRRRYFLIPITDGNLMRPFLLIHLWRCCFFFLRFLFFLRLFFYIFLMMIR